ncbi:MAG: reprolysin-like metallopeptidase [Bacteroidota bacterium]
MRKFYQPIFAGILFIMLANMVQAQNNFFTDAGKNKTLPTMGKRVISPEKFRTSTLDVNGMKNFLSTLPQESAVFYNRSSAPIMTLPMPDGSFVRYRVWQSSVQEPGLEVKFPEIKTFAGQGVDDPSATLRFDFNPYFGFSAQILSSKSGRVLIDPYARGDVNTYQTYYMSDWRGETSFECGLETPPITENTTLAGPCLGTQLRTYRLAFSCTGEFAQAVGAGQAGPTHAAIVTGVNRLTQVYEDELAVRLVLIANNNLIEFLNPATDPWQNDGSIAELNNITGNINTALASVGGSTAYDIGHLGCTASNAGVAGLGVVCGSSKGRGLTGGLNPVGDPYYIDYVAHEMGHQFNATHTFNSGNCASSGGSYEPGSGTTIMAYAGICSATENIQPNSDPIFHALSFDQIGNFISTGAGSACAAVTSTGNNLPTVTISSSNNLSIPISTPFVLDATATDPDGDIVSYNWEGWDLGAAGTWPSAAASTTRPLFRTRVSKLTGSRTFPDMRVIVANYPGTTAPSVMDGLRGEVLPTVARTMKFRLTVRDNRAGGSGVVSAGDGCQSATIFQVNAVGTTPFAVTFPNGGESFAGGSSQTITWNNASTNAAPFNVANVRITYSTDGGLTYPTVLLASTTNDGSEAVVIPVGATTTARIRVEAVGNIFFDISNNNFSVTAPVNGFTFNSPSIVTATCPAPLTMTSSNLTATYTGSYTGDISLSGTVNPSGPTVSFGNTTLTTGSPSTTVSLSGMSSLSPGSYTVTVTGIGAGGPTITRDITFTITAGSGPTISSQPSNVVVCIGQTGSFTVTSSGTYQWQVSTNGGSTWSNISGASTATYAVTGATAINSNQYRCIVTGQCGSTTSSAATLTVNPTTAITTQPVSLALCSGSAASFTTAAAGAGLTYQWQLSTDGGTNWNPIGGATTSTYNIAAVATSQNNNQFRCVVTGTCGSATTSAATLTVSSNITVSAQPVSQTVCEATTISFTSGAAGSGLSYQWQISTNSGASWANLSNGGVYSGATSTTLTITGVLPTQNGNQFRMVASNTSCSPGTSNAATLTVNTFPTITTQPQSVQVCEGANATFSVAASTGVGTLTYQWQFSTNGINYTNIPGATASSYTITGTVVGQNNYVFRVLVSAGCGTVNSALALLNVNPFPIISFNPTATVCKSDQPVALSATPGGGTFSGTGVTGSNFNPTVAGVGPKAVTYSVTLSGCTSNATRTILVNQCAERQLTIDKFPAIIVYPSPNNGQFNIGISTDIVTKLEVRVFNAIGQQIQTKSFSGVRYGAVLPMDISGQPSGTYQVYMVNDENGKVTTKAVSIVVYR